MPTSKLQLARYQVINACFTNRCKKYWTLNEILCELREKDLHIAERTLKLDFEELRFSERLGYFAPIRYCPQNRAYHYSDPKYSISKIELSNDEINALFLAADLIKPYEGIAMLRDFKKVICKIVGNFNSSMVRPGDHFPEIFCEENVSPRVAGACETLVKASLEKVVVEISILKSDIVQKQIFFRIHHLHKLGGDWYAGGTVEPEMNFVLLNLDSIESVSLTSRKFEKCTRTLEEAGSDQPIV